MTLNLSQLLLVIAMGAFALYAFRLRTVLADRVIYLALAGVGMVFVLAPELSTRVANLLNIGRGADLILYIFVVFSLFHFVTIASHLNTIERQITTLIRHAALADAQRGASEGTALGEETRQVLLD